MFQDIGCVKSVCKGHGFRADNWPGHSRQISGIEQHNSKELAREQYHDELRRVHRKVAFDNRGISPSLLFKCAVNLTD